MDETGETGVGPVAGDQKQVSTNTTGRSQPLHLHVTNHRFVFSSVIIVIQKSGAGCGPNK